MAEGRVTHERDAVADIRLTDLFIDVLAAMDSTELAGLVELADPLAAMLAAWALGVRNPDHFEEPTE